MAEPILEGTRHKNVVIEGMPVPGQPRLGRRESEPHSHEISYLYDVLSSNYPKDRTMWDLHHYFFKNGEKMDLQFDISYFRDFSIPYDISSYKADKYGGRIPTMAVNILSKSTYSLDIGLTAEYCRLLEIPAYIVFNPYLPAPAVLKSPYLKIYYIEEAHKPYLIKEIREHCIEEGEEEVDETKVLSVRPDIIPFDFGIMKMKRTYEKEHPRYRLVLIDRETKKVLPTREEKAVKMLEQERERAEKERERAEKEKERAEKEKERAEKEKERAEKEKERADLLEREIKRLQEKFESK